MESIRDRLGYTVREKRHAHHITQEQLAEKINVTTGMIGQIERGETMPSVETLEALIIQLDIDPKKLFWGTSSRDPEFMELYAVISRMTSKQRRVLLKVAKAIREEYP